MDKGVIVVGAGGHSKNVVAGLQALSLPIAGIVDDDQSRLDTRVLGVAVIGTVNPGTVGGYRGVLAVGSNAERRRLASLLDCEWVTVLHPRAFVDNSAKIGSGTVVMAGAVIQPDVVIGKHAIIGVGATVSHDCVIGDFAHIAPGVNLAGGVVVAEGGFIGVGAAVIPGVRIGAWATVGAGAAVIRDVPDGALALGVPAKVVTRA